MNRLYERKRHISTPFEESMDSHEILETISTKVAEHLNQIGGDGCQNSGDLSIYSGLPGLVLALKGSKGIELTSLLNVLAKFADGISEEEIQQFEDSYFFGKLGTIVSYHLLAGTQVDESILKKLINTNNSCNELLYGLPGAICGLVQLHRKGLITNTNLLADSVERLVSSYDEQSFYWEQKFPKLTVHYYGAAHGAIGNFEAIAIFARETGDKNLLNWVNEETIKFLKEYVLSEGGLANLPRGIEDNRMFVQWCHGAPGVILSCYSIFKDELPAELTNTVLNLTKLIVEAGFLRKDSNICHGDAGNALSILASSHLLKDEEIKLKAHSFFHSSLSRIKVSNDSKLGIWDGLSGILWVQKCFEENIVKLPFM